jgi:hypothetical protein
MASSISQRLAELEDRLEKAEKKARAQHGQIVALLTALKDKDK